MAVVVSYHRVRRALELQGVVGPTMVLVVVVVVVVVVLVQR